MHKLIAYKWLSLDQVFSLCIECCLSEQLLAVGSDESHELSLGGVQERDEFVAA